MAKLTFVGGIHPYDGKELSKDKPIKEVLPKGDLVYPLSQHIGAPATPVVAKGDRVLTGQKIAEASGFVSAPIYATVSGTVKAIEPRRVVTGDNVMSIVIENDGEYEEVEYSPVESAEQLSKEEIIGRVKEAGVVGMGGAGFPTFIKLSPKEPEKIDYVIANCAECEPYLTSDYRRMLEEPEKLIEGLKIMLRLFDNARGILAVEDNKPDCIELLKTLTKDETRISVKALKTKYPQGAERQLIYATTGRSINSKMLPADAGCVVNNVDTIVAIYHAVMLGKPLMNRIVTVTGDAIADPRNFIVRIGTNYHELVEEAGGFKEKPVKIVSGGPMMGFGIFDLDVPTTKTASALLCLTQDDVSKMEPSACINCGKCVEVCPGRVLPRKLADFAEHYDEEAFLSYNGMECCECGCCSFVCPAKRPLTQTIKSMRKMQLAKRGKKPAPKDDGKKAKA
jgi:electron transport complex protein RnfC